MCLYLTLIIVSLSLVGPSLWIFGISALIVVNLMPAKGIDVIWSRATNYFFELLKKNSPTNIALGQLIKRPKTYIFLKYRTFNVLIIFYFTMLYEMNLK